MSAAAMQARQLKAPKAKPVVKHVSTFDPTKRERSATKRGPGRLHMQGKKRKVERVKKAGGYGRGLLNQWTRQQREAIEARRKAAAK